MGQTERGKSLQVTPEVRRAIVREIKLRLLQKLREDGQITGEEYEHLAAGYRTSEERWGS